MPLKMANTNAFHIINKRSSASPPCTEYALSIAASGVFTSFPGTIFAAGFARQQVLSSGNYIWTAAIVCRTSTHHGTMAPLRAMGRQERSVQRNTVDIELKYFCDSEICRCHRFDDMRLCDVINLSYSAARLRLIHRGYPKRHCAHTLKGFDMRMKQLFVSIAVAATTFAANAQAVNITGAGATFPYPIYAKWAEMYKAATGNGLNYQSVGSGAGIKQIKAKTVDFGASDMPLTAAELDAGRPDPVPGDHGRRGRRRQPGGRDPGPAEADRRRCWPTSTWARSPSGTRSRSPR